MSQSLRLLIVEDSEDDAFLMQHTLRQGGYAVTAEVVQTEPAMRAALENQKWDIITSDHSMPRFNARDSLALAKRLCPEVPFIIVSGEIDLNLAVSLMRGGAEDYIQKCELVRLVPAVERELRELALHREHQQVDRALIQSDERLREVLENSLNVAYKRNIQTQSYDYLSPVTTRITGYTPDELMSLPQEVVLSWIHPDDIGEYTRLVAEGVFGAAGTEAQVEFRFRHKDGHYLWLRDSFIVILDIHDKPLSRIGTISDITDRKRSDAERDALLEIMHGLDVTKDLHEILSLVHHSVAKVFYAENFFVVFYNKVTGLFEEVYSVDQYDPPAPPSRLEKSITAYTLRTGKPIIMTQALFDQLEDQGEVEMVGTNSASWLGAPLITPDGTIGVIAIQDYETADRYSEGDKNFLAYVGSQVALAIERKRNEEALRESGDKFKYVFDHSVVGKSITLPSGEINVNRAFCEMVGYSAEELAQRKWHEITHPDDLEQTLNAMHSLLSGEKETVRYNKRFIHKNGSVVWVDIGSALRRDEGDKPIYFITTLIDITRRMQAEEEIRQLNAELEQRVAERTAQLTAASQEMEAFSFSVSHDLRAPLRRMAGFSTILLQDYAGQLDEQGQHYLSRIQESSNHMGQLINDLLKLSRVTRADFSRQSLDLSSLAQRIAAELQSASPQRRVELDITANMLVQGDENLLKIVLENLLDNAYKFTIWREQAAIQVGVLEQEGRPVYFVRDNGAGFDMDSADRLFSPFQRLHTETEFPGTGIGLATVKRIIHRHGGCVWAESAVDKGAAFYFTLN